MITLTNDQEVDASRMADEMDLPNFSGAGTGKTHTTLQAIKLRKASYNWVIAPPIALRWWQSQFEEFLDQPADIIRTSRQWFKNHNIIMTYDMLRNMRTDIEDWFSTATGDITLTLDESHNVRNSVTAGKTHAVFGKLADMKTGIASYADTVWALSGTPQVNHYNDYYSQVGALHQSMFPEGARDYYGFEKRYTFKLLKQYHKNMQPKMIVSGSKNGPELNRIIYGDIGAIRRMEIEGLAEPLFRTLETPVSLSAEVRKAMKMPEAEIIKLLGENNDEMAKARRAIGLAKVKEVTAYIYDSSKSSPILVGCWHRDVIDAYCEGLRKLGLRVANVDGRTNYRYDNAIRDDFNAGDLDVLVGQMSKMGVSWNLQGQCRHVIIAEEHMVQMIIEQFYKRVVRRGQKHAVRVDVIHGEKTLDPIMEKVRLRKDTDAEIVHRVKKSS